MGSASWRWAAYTAAAITAGGLCVLHIRRKRKTAAATEYIKAGAREQIRLLFPETDYEPLELLRSERAAEGFAMMPSVNTLTFFQGDPAVAYEHLCERLKALVAANPWLCARFKRDPDMPVDNCMVLMVPKRPDWSTLLAQVDDCTLYPGQPATQLDPRLYPCFTDTAMVQSNQDLPVFKVTLVRTPHAGAASDFALLVSMCHNLGDGHTYYTICAGLGAGAVPVMNPVRKTEHMRHMDAAMGSNKTRWLESPLHFHSGLRNIFRCGPLRWSAYYVNDAWVEAQKAKHRQYYESVKGTSKAITTPPFVSTNDVIMSWWLSTGGYTDGKMFLNCRNRIGPSVDEDAGNYFATIHYHKHEFTTAGGIRRALVAEPHKPAFRSGPDRAPGMLRTLLGNVACGTNWCAISKRMDLPDCTQVLHYPLMPAWLQSRELAYIFRPTPDTVGIAMLERVKYNGGVLKVQRADMPALGARIY